MVCKLGYVCGRFWGYVCGVTFVVGSGVTFVVVLHFCLAKYFFDFRSVNVLVESSFKVFTKNSENSSFTRWVTFVVDFGVTFVVRVTLVVGVTFVGTTGGGL